jgi:hypothetical protein
LRLTTQFVSTLEHLLPDIPIRTMTEQLQPPTPNEANIAGLLSPPPDLSTRLSNSAKAYKIVTASATTILTQRSVDLDAFRSADPDDKTSGMRETVLGIKSDFARFADRETDLCKNVIAYGQLLNTLVSRVDTSV